MSRYALAVVLAGGPYPTSPCLCPPCFGVRFLSEALSGPELLRGMQEAIAVGRPILEAAQASEVAFQVMVTHPRTSLKPYNTRVAAFICVSGDGDLLTCTHPRTLTSTKTSSSFVFVAVDIRLWS